MTISARPSLAAPVFEWKGCQGHARKPHAERSRHGEHRTGEDVGEAAPLMPLERPKPLVWGAVKEAKRPAACIPDDRWRIAPLAGEGRGGVVRRVKSFTKRPQSLFSARPALGCALTLKSEPCGFCALL